MLGNSGTYGQMKMRVVLKVFLVGLVVLLSGDSLALYGRWQYHYNGPASGRDKANSIVMGPKGALYVAGSSEGDGTDKDFTVVSLDSSMKERWVYRYNGPGNSLDEANSVVADADGNLYVAGFSTGIQTGEDFTVVSLSASGEERWVYSYDGPEKGSDRARSVAIGTDGNLYVAGFRDASGLERNTVDDLVVISLTSSGAQRWIYCHDGPARSSSIAVGPDGNLYIAGRIKGIYTDFTVISLTPLGSERWVYRYTGPGDFWDCANSIIIGTDDNVYAAGYSNGAGDVGERDFTVVSLTSSGKERWVYRYNGPGNNLDEANSVAMGTDGNVYIAGYSTGIETDKDLTVISLTPLGGERWVYRYNGPGNSWDMAECIAVGLDGSVYAAGTSWPPYVQYDFTVIKLSQSGEKLGRSVWAGSGYSHGGIALSAVVGTNGNIYVAGYIGWDLTVIDFLP